MVHDLEWRNPGTATGDLNPSVMQYVNDPHPCHLAIGFSNVDCSQYTIREYPNRVYPSALDQVGVDAGRGATRVNPTIWQDLFSMMRVFGTIFIPVWHGFDTRYLAYNTLLGSAKLIKHTDGSQYLKFKDTEADGCYNISMIPSSGIIDGGDLFTPGIRIWNTDVTDAVEIKFVSSNSNVAFAGVLIIDGNVATILRDAELNTIETEVQALSSFSDLDDMVDVPPPPLTGWVANQSTAHGQWSIALTSGDGTIAATDIVPTADFLFCLEVFADLQEDSDRTATVEITEAAGDKTLTLRYDDGGGGGVVTTALDLTLAAQDTLGELESVVEALGQSWEVQAEASAAALSNNLAVTAQTNVLAFGRQALIFIGDSAALLKTCIQLTDQIRIVDSNSLANGRTYVVGHDGGGDAQIDLDSGLVEILGGRPADKVLFGPTATEIEVRVVRTGANQWLVPGDVAVWKTASPNVGDTPQSRQYASTCKHWRRTDLNVRYQGRVGDDDWNQYELEEDYSNYRKCFGCVVVNETNEVPGSAQETFDKYNQGADGDTDFAAWFTLGYMDLKASPMVEVKGCNGGPPGERCPFFEAQDPSYNLGDFFAKLMYGEWWTWLQGSVSQPYFSIEWRSPYSLAALAGSFPDNNTFLAARRLIQHISGGIGAIEHTDFAEDGSFFKLFSASNDDQDTAVKGQCELILGTSRAIPRYAATAMNAANVGTDLIDFWDLIWDSNPLSMKTIDDRGTSAS